MFGRVYRSDLRHYKIMASIFDQYEKASQSISNFSTSGAYDFQQDKTPIFCRKKVNFSPSEKITHLCVSGDVIIIAMANNVILRINLRQPEHYEEIELKKFGQQSRLMGMYLDPLGQHLFLSLVSKSSDSSPEFLYLARNSEKVKQLSKFRSHEVTALGWNYGNQSRSTTGAILVGTSRGLIIETEIGGDGEGGMFMQSGLEEYFKQVFDIGRGTNTPITGIQFHRVPDTHKYFIIATTPNRLYQFIGSVNSIDEKPLLLQIFKNYLSMPEKYETIESRLKHSQLQFYFGPKKDIPTSFGWLTESGILYCDINPYGTEFVISNKQLLKFPTSDEEIPTAFVLTEFHVLLLYSDNIKAVSLLSHQLVSEDQYIETLGKLKNIIRDPIKGSIWAYTDLNVFNFKVVREDRNVWLIYLDRKEYNLAKQYCRDNPLYVDQIIIRQAEDAFQNNDFDQSARYFSQAISISFEEIALKFLRESEIDPLKTFLKLKLNNLSKEDKTQVTMVVIWLIEIYLSQLGQLRQGGGSALGELNVVQNEFDQFLDIATVKECIKHNKGTIYDLMTSHGDTRNFIKFTIENQDFERVIRHHIYNEKYDEALSVLRKTSFNRRDLYYQFTPTLIQFRPKETVDTLISLEKNLNPAKLLPAMLMCVEQEQIVQAIRYLEYCVYVINSPDLAIHNYLLSLYAKRDKTKLMHYLLSQGADASSVHYDVHYALRLCREENLTEACVQLSALLGLWDTAVDLALQSSVELAKETANRASHDDQLVKKLWLKIAEHVIKQTGDHGQNKNDIKQAMELLKECDLIKIEDILPFFPDFVTIDDFKDAICSSLQEYNQHIQDLKQEMNDATKSAEIIRQEINAFKNRYNIIRSSDTCSLCDIQLLLRPFYLFPCGHRFHADCLTSELLPLLPTEISNNLIELQKRLNQQIDTDNDKTKLDNILASECLFCGDFMIQSIDAPFIPYSEYDTVLKQWL